MRILQVNKFFDRRGGAETYLHAVSEKLRERGHEVHAFSTRWDTNVASSDRPYFVKRYAFDRKEGFTKDAKKSMAFLWNRESAQSLKRMIRDIQPDAVHLHNIYHQLSSSILPVIRRAGISCVQTLHDYKLACPNYRMFTEGFPCERCKGGKYYEAVKHQCLFSGYAPNVLAAAEMTMTKLFQLYERTVNTFLCPSRFMEQKMMEWGIASDKLSYLPNPIALPSDPHPSCRGAYVYIGRLYPEKGVDVLIRALAHVPNAQLEILGEGPERARLEVLAEEVAPARVSFLGFQTAEMVQAHRITARAVVVPSVWYENAPLSVLEALADGVPVIASDIGGLPELIGDEERGLLVKPGSVEAWIRALRRMELLNPQERCQLGVSGRTFVSEHMNWATHLDQLEDYYAR